MSWFKRKPKNRRLGREYVLDVKLRSSQVRAARNRLAAVGLGALFMAVLGLYAFWCVGDWALNTLVYGNTAFEVESVDIQTDGSISLDQLRRWTGVRLGENLLALDLARVQRDLKLVPLIQSVSVERILPHTLRVRVTEREPIAQINVPRPRPNGGIECASFLVDTEGWVMLPLDAPQRLAAPNPSADQFPSLRGVNPSEVQTGRRIESPQVQAALQLILAFESSPMAGLVELKNVDVSAPDVLTLTTGQGSEITFGLVDLDQQLRRWREIYDFGQKLGKVIATLDLAVSNNIPARWLEASAVPPETPKNPKNLRAKKRHV